jgi:hypothetical protein
VRHLGASRIDDRPLILPLTQLLMSGLGLAATFGGIFFMGHAGCGLA